MEQIVNLSLCWNKIGKKIDIFIVAAAESTRP